MEHWKLWNNEIELKISTFPFSVSTGDRKNVWNLWQKLWFYRKIERANKLKWVKILKNEMMKAKSAH